MSGPVVLVHIPKTAGSTFAALLKREVPGRSRRVPPVFRKPERTHERLREVVAAAPPFTFVHGHVPLTVWREYFPQARFATFLREPVARTYSHYRHALEVGSALEPFEVRTVPDNLQTRLLCGLPDPLTRPADDELLDAALRELDGFAFYGFTERFDESLLLARDALALRSIEYRAENVRGSVVPPDDVDALKRGNELDLELYAHALRLRFGR